MANVKVKLIGAFDMLRFKNQKKTRDKHIKRGKPLDIVGDWKINKNARELHPGFINVQVCKIFDHKDAHARTYILSKKDNSPLPYFRAGQYISIKLQIGNSFVSRAYSISSGPKWSRLGRYAITVKENEDGFVAPYILKNFQVGTELTISSPQGDFYYQKYRDNNTIVALAGGSGLTPFLSMGYAIKDGVEDYNLVIFVGSKDEKSILFKDELKEITDSTDKVKVIHVLSDENKKGYEHGFITSSLIKKYLKDTPYSIYICGPKAMYDFLEKELKSLKLPRRLIRSEKFASIKDVTKLEGYPKKAVNKTFNLTIKQGPNTYKIKADSNESILVAIERAGIVAPSRCRSGECGWCRSRVTKGTFFIAGEDNRRHADKESHQIHICITYPTSDMIIEVPGEYIE